MSGLGDKLKGSAKEAAGKVTGNEGLEAEGKKDKAVGEIKDKVDDAKKRAGVKVKDTLGDDKKNQPYP